jgi:hypothetical protein
VCRFIRARSSYGHTTPDADSATTFSVRAAAFVDLVAYYRTVLKDKGELVFDVPATHEFDVGKFNEEHDGVPARG